MKVLLAGESWSIVSQHTKGFDFLYLGRYEEACGPLIKALQKHGIEVDYMPNHVAQLSYPDTMEELSKYDVLILSDIGSNNLLLHPDMQFKNIRMNNRLSSIKKYVHDGGGFLMCGGWMSFTGFEGKARYGMTPLADVLPVTLLNYDDRMEEPNGIFPTIIEKSHPVLDGISETWPDFLGYNKLKAKSDATVIAKFRDDDFMVAGEYGEGRSFAFATDCLPHWGTPEFVNWESYAQLWKNIISWLSKK